MSGDGTKWSVAKWRSGVKGALDGGDPERGTGGVGSEGDLKGGHLGVRK
jgi:hypothetical protein